MERRVRNETVNETGLRRRGSSRFRHEWLNEIVETELPTSDGTRIAKLGDIFQYRAETADVICQVCQQASAPSNFSNGKRWDDWKMDYLKRHLHHKVHLESVSRLRFQIAMDVERILNETSDVDVDGILNGSMEDESNIVTLENDEFSIEEKPKRQLVGPLDCRQLEECFISLVRRADPAQVHTFFMWLDLKISQYKTFGEFVPETECDNAWLQLTTGGGKMWKSEESVYLNNSNTHPTSPAANRSNCYRKNDKEKRNNHVTVKIENGLDNFCIKTEAQDVNYQPIESCVSGNHVQSKSTNHGPVLDDDVIVKQRNHSSSSPQSNSADSISSPGSSEQLLNGVCMDISMDCTDLQRQRERDSHVLHDQRKRERFSRHIVNESRRKSLTPKNTGSEGTSSDTESDRTEKRNCSNSERTVTEDRSNQVMDSIYYESEGCNALEQTYTDSQTDYADGLCFDQLDEILVSNHLKHLAGQHDCRSGSVSSDSIMKHEPDVDTCLPSTLLDESLSDNDTKPAYTTKYLNPPNTRPKTISPSAGGQSPPVVTDSLVESSGRKLVGRLQRNATVTEDGGLLFVCPHCFKKFHRSSNFSRHMRIHRGVFSYVCTVCSRGFYRREHFNKHCCQRRSRMTRGKASAISLSSAVE